MDKSQIWVCLYVVVFLIYRCILSIWYFLFAGFYGITAGPVGEWSAFARGCSETDTTDMALGVPGNLPDTLVVPASGGQLLMSSSILL